MACVSRKKVQVAAAFIVMAAIIKKKQNRRKPRWWVKKIYQNRSEYGNRLLEDARFEIDDPNFVRMSKQDFNHLIHLIEPKVLNYSSILYINSLSMIIWPVCDVCAITAVSTQRTIRTEASLSTTDLLTSTWLTSHDVTRAARVEQNRYPQFEYAP